MKKTFSVKIPTPPNFLAVDGVKTMIPVTEFTEKELRKIGREWTEALVQKSKTHHIV